MIKICILLLVILCTACNYERYRAVDLQWTADSLYENGRLQAHLHEVETKKADLHGKEITLRGKLVYEYDDVAIYPIGDYSNFKPVWIHIEQDETALHDFLLENDRALVTVVGVLDTSDLFDDLQYSGAIKDILSVDVTHVLAKR
ncbi:hypothetical protein PQ465_06800 [Sphingobacterium oryzagri]|uniref:Uncharacterized protein n=1 Tax=Sphingobacterium oryzagri TaxID=3025669 RepID=A0ABY7WKF9_9SPHI|nr:hypothetical protein [Sphingobacterium sp. KACC 22765]WDF70081.1 hypothetical protein PQ465_06800 [Sphingobacterium sp. KACC 22765]